MQCSVSGLQTEDQTRFEIFRLLSQFFDPGERVHSSSFFFLLFSDIETIVLASQGSVWIN